LEYWRSKGVSYTGCVFDIEVSIYVVSVEEDDVLWIPIEHHQFHEITPDREEFEFLLTSYIWVSSYFL